MGLEPEAAAASPPPPAAGAARAPHSLPEGSGGGAGTVLQPVVFVVDASQPADAEVDYRGRLQGRGDGDVDGDGDGDGDAPFDVRRTAQSARAAAAAASATTPRGGDDAAGSEATTPCDAFLAALRGRLPGRHGHDEDAASVAASYASSYGVGGGAPSPFAPATPGSPPPPPTPPAADGGPRVAAPFEGFASPFAAGSPLFARLGRWQATSPSAGGGTRGDDAAAAGSDPHRPDPAALARDILEDDPDDAAGGRASRDNVHLALSSYAKDNPAVHFVSRRARVVSVSRRHAFPPSRVPHGKMGDDSAAGFGAMRGEAHAGTGAPWMTSYDVSREGILPAGWLEKHARALPSAIVVVASLPSLRGDGDEAAAATRAGIRNAARAVADLRLTLAPKRSVPVHLVCLLAPREGETDGGPSAPRDAAPEEATKEKVCQECHLPQSQVFLLRCPADLAPDDFGSKILRSPYLAGNAAGGPGTPNSAAAAPDHHGTGGAALLNPLLRRLDRALRDASALYYSRQAEAQERKLALWRSRYHGANASFEVNTLMAAMRCARYATKVATLREFQMRTGVGGGAVVMGGGSGAGGGAPLGGSGGGGARWTDRGSSAMRHYDEAYRWVAELHRRAVAWRAAAAVAAGASSASLPPGRAPVTPRATPGGVGGLYGGTTPGGTALGSPQVSESPGGGIGVELSLPGLTADAAAAAPPPPPLMRRDSPALTSAKGYDADENVAFFAALWEQCRAVASLLNAKLLRCTSPDALDDGRRASPGGVEAQEQWNRHRLLFLATPPDVPHFVPTENDDFFGPAWYRYAYVSEEFRTFACVAEGRWRRALAAAARHRNSDGASSSTSAAGAAVAPSYHQIAAPWKAHEELCEALLGLHRVVRRQMEDGDLSSEWPRPSHAAAGPSSEVRRNFVGSIVSGVGIGSMRWRFQNEGRRDHRAMALDYILHALDLLEENMFLCNNTGSITETLALQSSSCSSSRMHYLAGRLLMSLDNPSGALVHLKIAAGHTKLWPSLHLSVQRALFACESRCATASHNPAVESRDQWIELLLRSESCRLLPPKERMEVQKKVWKGEGLAAVTADDDAPAAREIVWTHGATSNTERPPFEFAVSFLKSTHAMSSDTVAACVSIKSCLDFEVRVESLHLLTTSGSFEVSNLEKRIMDRSLFQSGASTMRDTPDKSQGVTFNSKDLVFFLTEIPLPSDLSNIALGGSSTDTSKFAPKNGRLCNSGFAHAAGNICESRFDDTVSINGKPIALSDVPTASSSFLGGIPLMVYGVALTLKRPTNDFDGGSSMLKLQIQQPRLVSPLLRSGKQRLVMEESNYTAHAWSRPAHHPWCLGPRILRVLGPRPRMRVTNLTESQTDGKAVEGTVNRIMLMITAGNEEDCHDIRLKLEYKSMTKKTQLNDSAEDAALKGVQIERNEPHPVPIFVQKSKNSKRKVVMENGVALPEGWEPRDDVDPSVSSYLGAGKSLLVPLDTFRPNSTASGNSTLCTTSYEVIIMYKQIRVGKEINSSDKSSGDPVMVTQSGSIDWISPFTAEFSQSNGTNQPYPCGIQHVSNMLTQSQSSPDKAMSSARKTKLIAGEGERVQMRVSFKAKGLGGNVTASISSVKNEMERDEQEKVLYSPDSGLFMNQTKQGSTFSLSYSVIAQKESGKGNVEEVIPMGVIAVNWEPISLSLPDGSPLVDASARTDEFCATHGPLRLPNLTPIIFYGPQCQVLNAPFKAKLLKCPPTPKVGSPFCISYQVSNRTAKSQSLVLNLAQENDQMNPLLLCAGKIKQEMQMAPFEEKTFSFTFVSMAAGKILRPPLAVSSGRHQTWVINETRMSSRHLFVMP